MLTRAHRGALGRGPPGRRPRGGRSSFSSAPARARSRSRRSTDDSPSTAGRHRPGGSRLLRRRQAERPRRSAALDDPPRGMPELLRLREAVFTSTAKECGREACVRPGKPPVLRCRLVGEEPLPAENRLARLSVDQSLFGSGSFSCPTGRRTCASSADDRCSTRMLCAGLLGGDRAIRDLVAEQPAVGAGRSPSIRRTFRPRSATTRGSCGRSRRSGPDREPHRHALPSGFVYHARSPEGERRPARERPAAIEGRPLRVLRVGCAMMLAPAECGRDS